jgi:hypothetical protein
MSVLVSGGASAVRANSRRAGHLPACRACGPQVVPNRALRQQECAGWRPRAASAARCGHNCGQMGYWASIFTSTPVDLVQRHWLAASERTLQTAERHGPRHEPSTPAMTCADSAQCLSATVTHRRHLTAWRRHDLGMGARASPSLETAPYEWSKEG